MLKKKTKMEYWKEISQFVGWPLMIYVMYRLSYWAYKKLEDKGFLNEE